MNKYVFVETRDPFEFADVRQTWDLAAKLAANGSEVTMYLVQNGVLGARRGAKGSTLDADSGVTILADDLSLAERAIPASALRDGIEVADIDTLTELVMEDGRKPVWT